MPGPFVVEVENRDPRGCATHKVPIAKSEPTAIAFHNQLSLAVAPMSRRSYSLGATSRYEANERRLVFPEFAEAAYVFVVEKLGEDRHSA